MRKQFIIKEKLKFPSGTATALMISVLHGKENNTPSRAGYEPIAQELDGPAFDGSRAEVNTSWESNMKILFYSFAISGVYVGLSGPYTIFQYSDVNCLDFNSILLPNFERPSSIRPKSCYHLVVDTKPFAGLYRARYHYGHINYTTHASWSNSRLGPSISTSKEQRMGTRSSERLAGRGPWVDRLGQFSSDAS